MNNCIQYFYKRFLILFFFLGVMSCSREQNISFSDTVKVALREVGHHLLLTNQDSTTVVKPIVALGELKYQLSFEKRLGMYPDSLVTDIRNSFKKASLPQDYLIEVIQCADKEVAYSYYMEGNIEKRGIHCSGRQLKTGCYTVYIKFAKAPRANTRPLKSIYLLLLGVFLLVAIVLVFYKIYSKNSNEDYKEGYESIGKYKFYPEENKLIKEATEISLSKKECELLSMFIAYPNQIIKRDELTKKVWEDKGVIVGRSLDTYISKLRKKLQDDPSIKLTNIHGVGYKLMIEL